MTRLVLAVAVCCCFVSIAQSASVSVLVGGADSRTNPAEATGYTNQQILNDVFVLNLALGAEWLESAAYATLAGYNKPASPVVNQYGDSTSAATFDALFTQAGSEEMDHATLLQAVIQQQCALLPPTLRGGCAPVKKCTDYPNSGYQIPAGCRGDNSRLAIATCAAAFEYVGENAYTGAANLINNATILRVAAGILAVEAEHASVFRLISGTTIPNPPPAKAGQGSNIFPNLFLPGSTVQQVLCQVLTAFGTGFIQNPQNCPPWNLDSGDRSPNAGTPSQCYPAAV